MLKKRLTSLLELLKLIDMKQGRIALSTYLTSEPPLRRNEKQKEKKEA